MIEQYEICNDIDRCSVSEIETERRMTPGMFDIDSFSVSDVHQRSMETEEDENDELSSESGSISLSFEDSEIETGYADIRNKKLFVKIAELIGLLFDNKTKASRWIDLLFLLHITYFILEENPLNTEIEKQRLQNLLQIRMVFITRCSHLAPDFFDSDKQCFTIDSHMNLQVEDETRLACIAAIAMRLCMIIVICVKQNAARCDSPTDPSDRKRVLSFDTNDLLITVKSEEEVSKMVVEKAQMSMRMRKISLYEWCALNIGKE